MLDSIIAGPSSEVTSVWAPEPGRSSTRTISAMRSWESEMFRRDGWSADQSTMPAGGVFPVARSPSEGPMPPTTR
jgi:hypothetical protein